MNNYTKRDLIVDHYAIAFMIIIIVAMIETGTVPRRFKDQFIIEYQ